MKRATLFAVILSLSMPAVADDAERLVLDQVVRNIVRTACEIRGQRVPPVIASRTVGGAEGALNDLAVKWYGRTIGFEIAGDYAAGNRERVALEELMSLGTVDNARLMELEFGEPDSAMWTAVDEAVPGARSIVFVSRPAFDRLQTFAFVRTDLFLKDEQPWTTFNRLERQPDGSWIIAGEAMGSPQFMRSEQAHLHHANDSAYFHARD